MFLAKTTTSIDLISEYNVVFLVEGVLESGAEVNGLLLCRGAICTFHSFRLPKAST